MSLNLSTLTLCLAVLASAANTAFAQSDDNVQQIFDEAIHKRETGKIYDAIELFETILNTRPSLNRARLELAVAYHKASRYKDALREFKIVLDDPKTPESVRISILAYLGQLSRDELKANDRNDFTHYAKTGLIHNSNINVTPGKGQVLFPNRTDTSLGAISSFGVDIQASAAHRYSEKSPMNIAGAATHFEWQNQASFFANIYEETGDYDLIVATVSTGPALISPGRWRALADFRVDQILLGSSTLATFISLYPTITFDFGGYKSLTLESSVIKHNYSKAIDADRDGYENMIGVGYTTFLKDFETGLEVGTRLANNSAELDEFAYRRIEIYFGGFITTTGKSNAYLKLSNKQIEYDGPDSTSGIIRDEIENHLALGYNLDITDGVFENWTLNAETSFTDNNSNINAFTFDRTMVTVNISRYFQ